MNLIYLRQNATTLRPNAVYLLLKYAIVLTLLGLMAWELICGDRIETVWQAFARQVGLAHPAWFWAVVLAMPVNWLCESVKWHYLLQKFSEVRFRQAWRGVMLGVAFGLFTPNRIGEWGGRLLFVPETHRWKAFMANVVSMISQFIVIIAFGALGLLWFVFYRLPVPDFYRYSVVLLIFIALPALLLVYFQIRLFLPLLHKIPFLKRIKPLHRSLLILGRFRQKELSVVLGWAALRYLIYTGQYFCLLHYFGIHAHFGGLLAGIFTLFLLQTGLPLPPLMGLVARGSLAIQVWSLFGANDISSLAATSALWIINLILPALVGTFFLIYVKIPKTYSHEQK